MVTNGHVIHIMGHATQALGVCASQEVPANQGLKHSSVLGGALRKGGQGYAWGSREKDTGGKDPPWPKHKSHPHSHARAHVSSLKIKVRTSRMIDKVPKGALEITMPLY